MEFLVLSLSTQNVDRSSPVPRPRFPTSGEPFTWSWSLADSEMLSLSRVRTVRLRCVQHGSLLTPHGTPCPYGLSVIKGRKFSDITPSVFLLSSLLNFLYGPCTYWCAPRGPAGLGLPALATRFSVSILQPRWSLWVQPSLC